MRVRVAFVVVAALVVLARAEQVRLQANVHGVPMQGEVQLDTAQQLWRATLWTEDAGKARVRLEVGGHYFRETDGSLTFDSPYGKTQMRVRRNGDGTYAFLSSNADVRLANIRPRVAGGLPGPPSVVGPTGGP